MADPARWPGAVQTAFLGVVALAYLALVLISDGLDASWVVAPLFGALIWRFDGLAVWEIASWTIPVCVFMLVASAVPGPVGLGLSLVGVGVVVLMAVVPPVAYRWLAFVHRIRNGTRPPAR
jgi:hypothetical protein